MLADLVLFLVTKSASGPIQIQELKHAIENRFRTVGGSDTS